MVTFLGVGVYRLVTRVVDRRLSGGTPDARTAAFQEHLDDIRLELDALREQHRVELSELHERVDFAERLLARPDTSSAPAVSTPS